MRHLVIVRGGGELGTAVAHRLHRVGYKVLILEKSRPSALRRELSFSDAVYDGEKTVERVTCTCAENLKTALYSLGRIIYNGRCRIRPTTEDVIDDGGFLRAHTEGTFKSPHTISHIFRAGDVVAEIYDDSGKTIPVVTPVDGVLRGLLHDNVRVTAGMAVAEIDPRTEPANCCLISDKARCISGSVLEAIMAFETGGRP